jgi:hypothetical protein
MMASSRRSNPSGKAKPAAQTPKRKSLIGRMFGEDDALAEAEQRAAPATRPATAAIDTGKMNGPRVYLVRMIVFLVLVGFLVMILAPQILGAFMANPGLNGLIVGVLLIGVLMTFIQVMRLFREVSWVNTFRLADPGLAYDKPPVLLAPMAAMLRDRAGFMAITPQVMRSLLESLAMRLDESREIARYMTGLLVFLGLLGTFWGLLQTVAAVAGTIQALDVGSPDMGVIFEDLKSGLAAPLEGMGTAFSSSLFGLSGSLVLGFLDLQAGQAQNRFYTDVEDWLSTVTDVSASDDAGGAVSTQMQARLESLTEAATAASAGGGGSSVASTKAMADLADSIQGMVRHMQAERQTMTGMIQRQETQQEQVQEVMTRLLKALEGGKK